MPIDYARMQLNGPKLKAMLTRAQKTGRYSAVLAACIDATHEWDAIGAWPDNWSHWQRALDDAATKSNHAKPHDWTGRTTPIFAPRLEDL